MVDQYPQLTAWLVCALTGHAPVGWYCQHFNILYWGYFEGTLVELGFCLCVQPFMGGNVPYVEDVMHILFFGGSLYFGYRGLG